MQTQAGVDVGLLSLMQTLTKTTLKTNADTNRQVLIWACPERNVQFLFYFKIFGRYFYFHSHILYSWYRVRFGTPPPSFQRTLNIRLDQQKIGGKKT